MAVDKKNVLLAILFVLVFVTGFLSGGLYIFLTKFSPSGASTPGTTYTAPAMPSPGMPHARPPMAGPSGQPAAPGAPQPPPQFAPPPGRPLGAPPGNPPGQTPGPGGMRPGMGFNPEGPMGPGGRSEAFRQARRAIFTEGREPDWGQFEGQELEILQRAWERYQQRQQMRENYPGRGEQ